MDRELAKRIAHAAANEVTSMYDLVEYDVFGNSKTITAHTSTDIIEGIILGTIEICMKSPESILEKEHPSCAVCGKLLDYCICGDETETPVGLKINS